MVFNAFESRISSRLKQPERSELSEQSEQLKQSSSDDKHTSLKLDKVHQVNITH